MFSNTKLLVLSSFLIITLGLGLLLFGLKPNNQQVIFPSPSPIAVGSQTTSGSVVTSSALPAGQATQGIEGERALVVKAVDGDTVELDDGQAVRLIGIDTPETVDPRRPVGCFGKEASNETKKLLTGKMVILQKDISNTDKYQRLLRYVYLPLENGQILFINDYLVRTGFAKVYTYQPDVKFNEQFRQAETEARENKKGLWGRC